MRVAAVLVAGVVVAAHYSGLAESVRVPQWQVVGADSSGLKIVTSKQLKPRLLARSAVFDPTWSPGGAMIAFAREAGKGKVAIDVVRATGGVPRTIAKPREPFDLPLTWAPDGRRLAFVDNVGNVDVAEFDGSGRRVISVLGGVGGVSGDAAVSWSPDSKKIVYLGIRGVYSSDADGRNRHLLAHGRALSAPTWSPDGRLIAYWSRCSSPGANDVFCDVNVMNADGSRKRRLLQDIPYLGPVVWSRDSKTIFFTAYLAKPPGGIVRLDVRTGAARVIAPWATNLFLAQDGRTIGFIEEDSGAVVIATLDGHILGKHSLPRGFPDNLDLRVGQS